MKIEIKSPVELIADKVLGAIPEGVAVSEAMLRARLRHSLKENSNCWRVVDAMADRLQIVKYTVPGSIWPMKQATVFYCRPLLLHGIREQTNVPDRILSSIHQAEGFAPSIRQVFSHKDMPAKWQHETILLSNGVVIARGSFGELAKVYAANIKNGRGKMVIHRLGTKFEPDPNKLLRAFRAAVKNAAGK